MLLKLNSPNLSAYSRIFYKDEVFDVEAIAPLFLSKKERSLSIY